MRAAAFNKANGCSDLLDSASVVQEEMRQAENQSSPDRDLGVGKGRIGTNRKRRDGFIWPAARDGRICGRIGNGVLSARITHGSPCQIQDLGSGCHASGESSDIGYFSVCVSVRIINVGYGIDDC